MGLTVYNLLMSLFWSDVCILLFCLLRRRYAVLRDYGFAPLFCLLAFALVRFFIPVELPFTVIVPSYRVLPAIQTALWEPGFLGLSWYGWLGAVWGVVTLVLLLRLMLGMLVQRLRIAAMPRSDNAVALQAVAAILPPNVRWKPTVVISPEISVPSVTGFFAPIFLLPTFPLSQRHLEEILRHELGHFAGRDAWIKLWISIFQAIFWWNPLVYLLGKDLSYLLEVRADAYATRRRTEEERINYLEAVTEVVRQLGLPQKQNSSQPLSLHGSGKRDEIYERMQLVFAKAPRPRRKGLVVICLLALLLVSYAFVLQPRGFPTEKESFSQADPENAYLVLTSEGQFKLYINGEYYKTLNQEDLIYSSFNLLEIRKEN